MIKIFNNELNSLLIAKHQKQEGSTLYKKYAGNLNASYIEKNTPEQAAADIEKMELLSPNANIEVGLQVFLNTTGKQHLKLYQYNNTVALSDIMPILENMGLRVLNEDTYEINMVSENTITINDFSIIMGQVEQEKIVTIKECFEEALKKILTQQCENDIFNQLITSSELNWQDVNIIRAYAKYLKQIKFRFTQQYIGKTLVAHPLLTKKLIQLFKLRHSPDNQEQNNLFEALENKLITELDSVKSIDEDIIIRKLLFLIKATVRTNFFQLNSQKQRKNYISLKIRSQDIPDMPLPKPIIDTFVYSSQFEGIHLRSHEVARGGIRWSDRHDDYRSEVLGLMKAQKVKNAIIIPAGAKGGFIVKSQKNGATAEERKAKAIHCYQQFIRGLLDITDNIKNNEVVHPANVVCHDGNDTYLVVAADKGTADFSDIANAISKEYAFWLGDAFASGGRQGYDHKKLGITAKGAWESLKRSLQELNKLDTEMTMVGIGDMSGDVFGNGLIYSDKIKLIAAFDHRHIFIDPNPNLKISFEERKRLFNMTTSSWENYNPALISQGGGVYQRSCKNIPITNEMKQALDITNNVLTPNELICAILKAPVDVLFNGGIGTYVKASHETSEDVGDKTNELCRVNGNELRCKIVCEGGNLGFTQLSRVEYALNGGIINTDFIDNSAGVDCSDHEVNLKIALNNKLENDEISFDARNKILAAMENDVCDLVLHDNYAQALVMSYSALHACDYAELYQDHITKLEEVANLNRKLEFLPSNEQIQDRKLLGKGLTKPELAVLLAYTKIYVKEQILKSNLPENSYFNPIFYSAFPKFMNESHKGDLDSHLLKREIIATQISNHLLNNMGITFPFRLQNETGASMSDIATAQQIAATIYDTETTQRLIHSLDGKISIKLQYELLHQVRQLLNMATRWFLRNGRLNNNLTKITHEYSESVKLLADTIPDLIVGSTKDYLTKIKAEFIAAGLPADLAKRIATSRVMYTALNITEVANIHRFDLDKTAKLYFHVGGAFNLVWFRDFFAKDNRPDKRSSLARLILRDSLDALQRRLVTVIMQSDSAENDISTLVKNWSLDHAIICQHWQEILKNVQESQHDDYTLLFIALHELTDMIDSTTNNEKTKLLAYHDALTLLPNRFAIMDRVEQLQLRADRDNRLFAIHFIDLDKFKAINDTHGHDIGDKVLIEVTKRLLKSVRSGDLVARMSGDEFIVLQSDVTNQSDANVLSDKLLQIINEPVYIDDLRLTISASIGIAIYPTHGTCSMELITNADKAMYSSKASGRGQVKMHETAC